MGGPRFPVADFILFSLLLLIHLPPVQHWGINKITRSISNTLKTKATIKGFSLNPISDLTLKQIYIGSPDHPDDTLLYAGELTVDYKRLWDIFKHHFTINQISVREGTLNIHRLPHDSLTNLDVALLKMLPPRDTSKPAFVLNLHQINAGQLRVNIDDEYNGSLMRLYFNRADVDIDTMDVVNTYLGIRDLDLDDPFISITNRVVELDSNKLVTPSGKSWRIDVDHWDMQNGKVLINNLYKKPMAYANPNGIDYGHMFLDDIDLSTDSLKIRGWDFRAKNIDIHAKHSNGFEVKKMAADYVWINREKIDIGHLVLNTTETHIQNSIKLEFSGYKDFRDFADSVKIEIPAANMRLYLGTCWRLHLVYKASTSFPKMHRKIYSFRATSVGISIA